MLEILAQLVTFGAKLPTAVIAFIDNTAGQAALIKGYGKDDAVNGMISAFWSLAAHQGWLVEFERVPSKANVTTSAERWRKAGHESMAQSTTSSRSSWRRRRTWSTPPPTRRTSC